MNLLVVESPAKAKTINKYLGKDFDVIASFGHIRDLSPKSGSVKTDNDFEMVWEIAAANSKHVKDIISHLKGKDTLYLATDPDREGEAISWHIYDVLKEKGLLKNVTVKRVTFNEITKSAVEKAMSNPRNIDDGLVDSYMARRALDYLFGFTLSPLLWKKLPGSRSAGRVQSVALRLISERESEIEAFNPVRYFSLDALFKTAKKSPFSAYLHSYKGKKLDKLEINSDEFASEILSRLKSEKYKVAKLEKKSVKRYPYAPFTTSTLQQEAAKKLHFSAKQTMQVAQRLYEGVDIGGSSVGLITYMRTDGIDLAQDALFAIRNFIGQDFGSRYLPEKAIIYKNKVKNAQEAHEAIRPTDISRTPRNVAKYLNNNELKLYELIWNRTLACQMTPAEFDQVSADIAGGDGVFRATGSTETFDGFLKVYNEARDVDEADEVNRALPIMEQGEEISLEKLDANEHFTAAPPRYTEASLVKKLEELGIGRPSTYASIISVLQDRDYVRLESRRFIPEERGRIVSIFLSEYFPHYVEYGFTAKMEEELDEIAAGKIAWRATLSEFWGGFDKAVSDAGELKTADILENIEKIFMPHLFASDEERVCPECKNGRLSLKFGRFGAFIACSNYPECKYTKELDGKTSNNDFAGLDLGLSETGDKIELKTGKYGAYLEAGTKKVSLPKNISPDSLTSTQAQKLISMPFVLGLDDDKEEIKVSIGRFGPYVQKGKLFKSIPAKMNLLTITLDEAKILIAGAEKKAAASSEIGTHPKDGKPIIVASGRFGPYLRWGKIMVSLPKAIKDDMSSLTLAKAIEMINEKAAKTGALVGTRTKKAKK